MSRARFSGAAEQFKMLKDKCLEHPPDGPEIVIAVKSVAIITKVPKIGDPHCTTFDNCTAEANSALQAINKLIVDVQRSPVTAPN